MSRLFYLLVLAMMLYFSLRSLFRPPRRPPPKKEEKKNLTQDFANAGEMVADPVCGMFVDPEQALFLIHEDQKFYFCGPRCQQEFLARLSSSAPKNGEDKAL